MYTKTYKWSILNMMIIFLSLIFFQEKLKKYWIILIFLFYSFYNILKYDLEIYNIGKNILLPYITPYMYIYSNVLVWYIFIIISLICTKFIYDQIYEKIFEMSFPDPRLSRDLNGQIFFFILYLSIISLIIFYFFFGDILMNINLENFGYCLDIITYIFTNIKDIIILIINYIWIALKEIIDIVEILLDLLYQVLVILYNLLYDLFFKILDKIIIYIFKDK